MTAEAATVRFAVITDVHANLPALDAALAAIDRDECDFVVHTGDAIGIGPYPAETLDRMLGRPDVRFVMGNQDALFAFGLPSPRPAWASVEREAHQRWTHAQIDPSLRDTVREWPYRITLELNGRSIAFCHYARTPEQCANEGSDHPDPLLACGFASIIAHPISSDLDALFADLPADLLFYGQPPSAIRPDRARTLRQSGRYGLQPHGGRALRADHRLSRRCIRSRPAIGVLRPDGPVGRLR